MFNFTVFNFNLGTTEIDVPPIFPVIVCSSISAMYNGIIVQLIKNPIKVSTINPVEDYYWVKFKLVFLREQFNLYPQLTEGHLM